MGGERTASNGRGSSVAVGAFAAGSRPWKALPARLRTRVVAWASRQHRDGASWEEIKKELGLQWDSVRRSCQVEAKSGSIDDAAAEHAVSKQTILNWVKAKKVQYAYATRGRRRGLRIDTKSAPQRKQGRLWDQNRDPSVLRGAV